MAYITVAELETYLQTTLTAEQLAAASGHVETATAIIENVTGRVFFADSTASARNFDGSGMKRLPIDDAVDVTAVTIDDVTETDWVELPSGKLPIQFLERDGYALWPRGQQNIAVTAKWGYSTAVPADVKDACLRIAAGLLFPTGSQGAASPAGIKSESIEGYSVTYAVGTWNEFATVAPDLAARLAAYRRPFIL